MKKPKEMTIAFMTPKRNQLMIDRMVLAVQEFAVKHAGLDKLVIEIYDSSELRKKDETIQKLIKVLEFYASLTSHSTKARQVLKEVRPEPLIIIDEGDDDGKV